MNCQHVPVVQQPLALPLPNPSVWVKLAGRLCINRKFALQCPQCCVMFQQWGGFGPIRMLNVNDGAQINHLEETSTVMFPKDVKYPFKRHNRTNSVCSQKIKIQHFKKNFPPCLKEKGFLRHVFVCIHRSADFSVKCVCVHVFITELFPVF